MATEINRAPVLTGKAAQDFYKSLKKTKEGKSTQEVQEVTRKWRKFMSINPILQ